MNRIKGILYAAVSSSTFGLAPFFSITLLLAGFSAFEVLSYRWGVASIVLIVFGWLSGCNFRLAGKDWYYGIFYGSTSCLDGQCRYRCGEGRRCCVLDEYYR